MCLSLFTSVNHGVTNRAPFPPEINQRTPGQTDGQFFFPVLRLPPAASGFLFLSGIGSAFGISLGVFFFFFAVTSHDTLPLLLLLLLLQLFWPCSSIALSLLCRLSLSVVPSLLHRFSPPNSRFSPFLSSFSFLARSLLHIELFTLPRLAQLVQAIFLRLAHLSCPLLSPPRPFLSPRVLPSTRDRIIIRHHTNHLRLPTIQDPNTTTHPPPLPPSIISLPSPL